MGQTLSEKRTYLDTNIFIYIFENNLVFGSVAEKLFSRLRVQKTIIIASPLIITELLIKPLSHNNELLINAYKNLPSKVENWQTTDFSNSIAIKSAELRATYKISLADSIHLATAISQDCATYYTNDENLTKVKEIKVRSLSLVNI